jgi:hypothetical protein
MFLKLLYTSSTHLPCLPTLRIYPGARFLGLKHLIYGTPGLVFLLEVDSNFLPILLLIPTMVTDPLYMLQEVNELYDRTK